MSRKLTEVAAQRDLSNGLIHTVVHAMQAEIDELLQQKAALDRRTRNLRRILSSLRGESEPLCRKIKSARFQATSKPQQSATSSMCRETQDLYDNLRRACRVALMEAGGTAKQHDIYAFIMRRGSFRFTEIKEEPCAAITHVLGLMERAGEVVSRQGGDHNPDWQFWR